MSIYTPRKRTDGIVIHCSATPPEMDIGAKEVRQWHRAKGWIDIGYHFVIRRDGTLEEGRPVHVVGAHVEGFNATTIGICLIGGVHDNKRFDPENNFTPAQFETLFDLITELRKDYPVSVKGHRDYPNVRKACPSFDAPKWWAEVNAPVIEGKAEVVEEFAVVRAGDTYWSLAKAHGVDMNAMIRLNREHPPTKLQPGVRLKLPR